MTDLVLTDGAPSTRPFAAWAAPAFERVATGVGSAANIQTTAEWRPLTQLGALHDAWQALAERALEPNVFYAPAFAGPAAAVFGADVGAVLVWAETDRRPALIGLFPARIDRRRFGPLLPIVCGWTHPFAPLGVPLVDRAHAVAAIAAWLDYLSGRPDLPDLLMLPLLPTAGAFAQALGTALAMRDGASVALRPHRRALLKPADRGGYLASAVSAKKRKELARQRRRLGDGASVDFAMASNPVEIAAARADFLALEAAGWKGRAHTAAAQDAALRTFITTAADGLAATGQIEIARLAVADQTLAAAIVLRSGDTAWFWKIAYDERAARGSPGVQIALDLTGALLADMSIAAVDSCAIENHPMIDHLWRERLELADLVIALKPAARRRLPLVRAVDRAGTAVIGAAKWARRRLRGR